MAEKIVGIYKELDENEKLLKSTPHLVEVHEIRGASLLGFKIGKKTMDTSFARVYLTNKNLFFLTFFVGELSELKSGKSDIQGITGDWMQIPLSQINKIEGGSKFGVFDVLSAVRKGKLPDKEDRGELSISYGKNSKITMILSQRDLWKALMEENSPNLSYKIMRETIAGALAKEYVKCETCGTKYEVNSVKMVKCRECGIEVCREAKIKKGLLRKVWKKTNCFDDKTFLCKSCLTKSK